MVAFGLDNKDNKKAKEFGDRLEAKQHSRESHKVKLDHPEFVDKTQIPKIRKEFRDKKISLWVRFTVCTVLTVLLMIFENIPLITKLFTGTEQQFAGVRPRGLSRGLHHGKFAAHAPCLLLCG